METARLLPPLTIVAVEDDPADSYIIRRVLDAHGLADDLHILENGADALHFFDQLAQPAHRKCPDLALLDLHLPQVSGHELLQRIKAIPACAGMRIVVMTGYAADPIDTLVLGADAFFEKPVGFRAYMLLGHLIKAMICGDPAAA